MIVLVNYASVIIYWHFNTEEMNQTYQETLLKSTYKKFCTNISKWILHEKQLPEIRKP